MDIDKSKIYTSINADELRVGDKVVVADNMVDLRNKVMGNIGIDELSKYARSLTNGLKVVKLNHGKIYRNCL